MSGKVADEAVGEEGRVGDGYGDGDGDVVVLSSRVRVSRQRAESLVLALQWVGVRARHCAASHTRAPAGAGGDRWARGVKALVVCLDAAVHGALACGGSGGQASEVLEAFEGTLAAVGSRGVLCVALDAELGVRGAWRGLVAFHLGGAGMAAPVAFGDDAALLACVWSALEPSVLEWLLGSGVVQAGSLAHAPSAVHHLAPSRFMPWLPGPWPGFVQHEVDRAWRARRREHARVWSSEHGGFVRRRDANKVPGDPSCDVAASEWVTFPFTGHWTLVPVGPPETMPAEYDGLTAREAVAFRANNWYVLVSSVAMALVVLACLGVAAARIQSGSGGPGDQQLAFQSIAWLSACALLFAVGLFESVALSVVRTALHPVSEAKGITALLGAHRRRAELQARTSDAVLPDEHPLARAAWGAVEGGPPPAGPPQGNPVPQSHGLVALEEAHRALAAQRALVSRVQREGLDEVLLGAAATAALAATRTTCL